MVWCNESLKKKKVGKRISIKKSHYVLFFIFKILI